MTQKKMHPRQDMERKEWKNLNGKWDFSFTEGKYNMKIEVPFSWCSPLSGIENKEETKGFYRKLVKWSPAGPRIFIVFGAVDYECVLTVNGSKMMTHKGGYSQFECELTDVWKRDGSNIIELSCEDKALPCQTYGKQGYGDVKGIWQTVYLEARPESFISNFKIKTSASGNISIDMITDNCADGTLVSACFEGNKSEAKVKNNRALIDFKIEDPSLWTCDDPKLYRGTLTLQSAEIDTVRTYFGIREVGYSSFGKNTDKLITLNGKPVFLAGLLDQSYNPQGFFTLPSDDECENEIARVKKAGFNTIRIHIKAEEPLKLYFADLLGVLVISDIPCFWGDPDKETREQFEKELEDQVKRDINHPSIIYQVIFNETWGLMTTRTNPDGKIKRYYSADTAKWVARCYRKVKKLDGTRLVEDNSACLNDHVITDVNTWHFYANGYGRVKKEISDFVRNSYPGSSSNYKSGYSMTDIPIMNSECGNYWGINGNAGESDISYQFKYMINEFRRCGKICGYIFTEFHDVINEFNGIYKIDNDLKQTGYETFGSSIADLNAPYYVGCDFPPVSEAREGDKIKVPLFISSFSDKYYGRSLKLTWTLWAENRSEGKKSFEKGEFAVMISKYGSFLCGNISFCAPSYNGPCILSWSLSEASGERKKIFSNYICFNFSTEDAKNDSLTISPSMLSADGWDVVCLLDTPEKVSGIGQGSFTYDIDPEKIPGIWDSTDIKITLEASTRFPMKHDLPDSSPEIFGDLMHGYAVDPGKNKNSFPQTDSKTFPGNVRFSLDDIQYANWRLPDCPADSRGFLSHFYQQKDDELREAGSYGYICTCSVPSSVFFETLMGKPVLKKSVTLKLSTDSKCGLSVFGRKGGRYGLGIRIKG